MHQIWTCPSLLESQQEPILSTSKCIQQAVDNVDHFPCLWLRGLSPESLVKVPEQELPD